MIRKISLPFLLNPLLFPSFSCLVYFAGVVSASRFYFSGFTQEDLRISRNPPTYCNFHEFFPLKLRFTVRAWRVENRLVCGLGLLKVYWERGYGGFACKLLELNLLQFWMCWDTRQITLKSIQIPLIRRNFIHGYIMRVIWTIFISTYC